MDCLLCNTHSDGISFPEFFKKYFTKIALIPERCDDMLWYTVVCDAPELCQHS